MADDYRGKTVLKLVLPGLVRSSIYLKEIILTMTKERVSSEVHRGIEFKDGGGRLENVREGSSCSGDATCSTEPFTSKPDRVDREIMRKPRNGVAKTARLVLDDRGNDCQAERLFLD
jgi:hypothetical protein